MQKVGLLLKSAYDAGSDVIEDDSLIIFADNVNLKFLIASMRNGFLCEWNEVHTTISSDCGS